MKATPHASSTKKRTKRGRPVSKDRMDHRVLVRMNDEDAERLADLAAAAGVATATLARVVVLDYLGKPRPLLGGESRVDVIEPSESPSRRR